MLYAAAVTEEHRAQTRRLPAVGAMPILYVLTALALRAVMILRCRYNTDEPQHLHVAWEWSRGLIAYRDFYDNHLPLFHLLVAPWIGAVGETPQILFYARLFMIPLVLGVLALTWLLAAKLYDSTVAWWATLAASISPPLLPTMVEFRNDTLWIALLLATVLLILHERSFIAGIVLGAALMVSIKTAPFAVALAIAFLLMRYGSLLRLIAGSVVVPAIVVAFFAFHGAADELFRWSVLTNGTMPVDPGRRLAAILTAIAIAGTAIWLAVRSGRSIRGFVALIAALYIALFLATAPLIGPRDMLPTYPILWIFIFAFLGPWTRHVAAMLLVLLTIADARLWQPQLPYYPRLIADTLRFTSAADPVFDQKGETVFRHRATYIALESVARRLLEAGTLPDTIAADVIASRAHVAVRDSTRIPPASRRFLNRYFVPFGAMRVAGQYIHKDGTFEIAVPGMYTVVHNGRVFVSSRWYEPGTYRGPLGAVALWSDAVGRAGDLSLELQRPEWPAE
jgi:hypothetical protein